MESKTGAELFIASTPFVIVLASWLLAVLYVRKSPAAVQQFLEAIARKRFKK